MSNISGLPQKPTPASTPEEVRANVAWVKGKTQLSGVLKLLTNTVETPSKLAKEVRKLGKENANGLLAISRTAYIALRGNK